MSKCYQFVYYIFMLKGSVSSSIPCTCRLLAGLVVAIFMAHFVGVRLSFTVKVVTTKGPQRDVSTKHDGCKGPLILSGRDAFSLKLPQSLIHSFIHLFLRLDSLYEVKTSSFKNCFTMYPIEMERNKVI